MLKNIGHCYVSALKMVRILLAETYHPEGNFQGFFCFVNDGKGKKNRILLFKINSPN